MVGPSVAQLSSRPIKICGVCGDRAKSYHFGGISCDSCKAFFRRSVQNDAYKNFHCPYEGECDITIMSRKCCQHCRFQKCISIGMEKSWVMTEEERLQMLKSRLEKRQKQDVKDTCKTQIFEESRRHKYDFEPDISVINNYLTDAEINLIESVINEYLKSCKEISFNEELNISKLPRNRTEILDMFFTAIQQFALFAQRFKTFKEISTADQEVLLRGGVLELCFVRGAFLFDVHSQSWPQSKSQTTACTRPFLAASDLKPLIRDDLIEKHMRFIRIIKDIDVDESTVMLLCVIILLSPDRMGLSDSHIISKQQEYFLILLRKYMNWRYSERISSILYPKLLLTLPELRELSEGHTDYHLWLCREELEEIQSRLSSLRLDPVNTQSCNESSKSPFVSWTLRANLQKRASSYDEELSTSSESSDKLLASD
ncbi:Vitamin D3 receptor B-like protein [Leptotrombidium deliense]|uniref:Vitamin D3 receptor B-like protein n=1 Tax=Leptotrombidium deliense TaxID=299467 RepID=A0A443S928_9ACAR|nr:Vitamin D3 receptor B-like protein [Leptotrombidium deliense]